MVQLDNYLSNNKEINNFGHILSGLDFNKYEIMRHNSDFGNVDSRAHNLTIKSGKKSTLKDYFIMGLDFTIESLTEEKSDLYFLLNQGNLRKELFLTLDTNYSFDLNGDLIINSIRYRDRELRDGPIERDLIDFGLYLLDQNSLRTKLKIESKLKQNIHSELISKIKYQY